MHEIIQICMKDDAGQYLCFCIRGSKVIKFDFIRNFTAFADSMVTNYGFLIVRWEDAVKLVRLFALCFPKNKVVEELDMEADELDLIKVSILWHT